MNPFLVVLMAADLSGHFVDIDGTFVLLNSKTGEREIHNQEHAARQFPPCSTFKIPNSVIALETGVVRDIADQLPYDARAANATTGVEGSVGIKLDAWRRPQSLSTAFRDSVVWFYQETARRVGGAKMASWVIRLNYGNEDSNGPVDRFWMGTPLAISAEEQVLFLSRLENREFALSPKTYDSLAEIMLTEKGDGWTLSGKTGACTQPGQPISLWYVGTVNRNGTPYHFALHMSADTYQPLLSQRIPKAKAILKQLGVLP